MPRGPKSGFIYEGEVHAQKGASIWFRFGYCGVRAEIRLAEPVGIFRAAPNAGPCGGCVCAIEDEHRRGARA